jgi:hypothetical protein
MAKKTSVCQEAHAIIHGPRRKTYGHPKVNFTRTAAMVSAFLANKLKAPITPEEWGFINILAKVSRSANMITRDNLRDICGYAGTVEMVMEES